MCPINTSYQYILSIYPLDEQLFNAPLQYPLAIHLPSYSIPLLVRHDNEDDTLMDDDDDEDQSRRRQDRDFDDENNNNNNDNDEDETSPAISRGVC